MLATACRAALCVKWSPCGRKLAMGSSAAAVCIASYEADNDWWASKLIRRQHGSAVMAVALAPRRRPAGHRLRGRQVPRVQRNHPGAPCIPVH